MDKIWVSPGENQPVKFGDIVKNLGEHNQASIKKDLQYLVQELEIEKHGDRRGTVYVVRRDK